MISRPLSLLPVTDSCTIPPCCKCYGAEGRVFSPCEEAGCQDYPLEKLKKRQGAPRASCFFRHPLLHCKFPASKLMQICPPKNDILLRDASLVLLRTRPPPVFPRPPPVLHPSSLRGNPSAQLKRKHLQPHSSYSRFLLAE